MAGPGPGRPKCLVNKESRRRNRIPCAGPVRLSWKDERGSRVLSVRSGEDFGADRIQIAREGHS